MASRPAPAQGGPAGRGDDRLPQRGVPLPVEPAVLPWRYRGRRDGAACQPRSCRSSRLAKCSISPVSSRVPRFRAAIDAKVHADAEAAGAAADPAAPAAVRRLDALGAAERCAGALRAAARALHRDARHRRRRARGRRRSASGGRRDPDTWARSPAVAVPAAAPLEGGARSLPEDDERDRRSRPGSRSCGRTSRDGAGRRRRSHRQVAAGQHRHRRSCASTTSGVRRRTPSSSRSSSIASKRRSRRSRRWR